MMMTTLVVENLETCDILSRVTRRLDAGSRSRSKAPEHDHGSGWYKGESSRQRHSDHKVRLNTAKDVETMTVTNVL